MNTIEISVTKDLAEKLGMNLTKTESTEPSLSHWYAKVLVFNRKRYVLAVNTFTRYALVFRLNKASFKEDFEKALKEQFLYDGLDYSKALPADICLSLGNNRALTSQLNNCGQDLDYLFYYKDFKGYSGDYADLYKDYNKSNLGKAGNSKDMVFALDEMKKYF